MSEKVKQDDGVRPERGVALVLRILTTLSAAVMVLMNALAWKTVPKFEQIFADLLGSADQLPGLTKLVVWMGTEVWPAVVTSFVLPLIVVVWVWRAKIPLAPACVALAGIALLFVQWMTIIFSLFLPMMKVVQGIG